MLKKRERRAPEEQKKKIQTGIGEYFKQNKEYPTASRLARFLGISPSLMSHYLRELVVVGAVKKQTVETEKEYIVKRKHIARKDVLKNN